MPTERRFPRASRGTYEHQKPYPQHYPPPPLVSDNPNVWIIPDSPRSSANSASTKSSDISVRIVTGKTRIDVTLPEDAPMTIVRDRDVYDNDDGGVYSQPYYDIPGRFQPRAAHMERHDTYGSWPLDAPILPIVHGQQRADSAAPNESRPAKHKVRFGDDVKDRSQRPVWPLVKGQDTKSSSRFQTVPTTIPRVVYMLQTSSNSDAEKAEELRKEEEEKKKEAQNARTRRIEHLLWWDKQLQAKKTALMREANALLMRKS